MSDFVVYLKVKPFLRQWLQFHYGNPVRFPDKSVENATIRRFLTTLPKGTAPQMGEIGDIPVCIPDSKQKPVQTYNYLGKRAREALIECIEDTFKLQMWADLNDLHGCGCSILKAVRAWSENNGISIDYEDTIKMRYQRLRNSYLKSGIDLRNKRRNHDEEL